MATKQNTVVGVFQDRTQAQKAVDELRRMGFRDDQIGVATRNDDGSAGSTDKKDTHADDGAKIGVAAGAGVGLLWGLGAAVGLIPAIGPVIAGGTLAALVASGALGAAAAGLAGALIGAGIPEDEAKYYEQEFHSGRTVVTVKAETRSNEAIAVLRQFGGYDMKSRFDSAAAPSQADLPRAVPVESGGQTLQAREEELHVRKEPVQTGEVTIRKEVRTEHRTLEVPVMKEEVVIERRPVGGHQTASSGIGGAEEIRIPVSEEQVHIEKEAVVKEEVRVGKRTVKDTEQVSGTVRKEEIKVEKQGNVDVRDKR